MNLNPRYLTTNEFNNRQSDVKQNSVQSTTLSHSSSPSLSTSSSAAELNGIFQTLSSPSKVTPKTVIKNQIGLRPRKQHTLDSIELSPRIRSRSPIVDESKTYNHLAKQHANNNPFHNSYQSCEPTSTTTMNAEDGVPMQSFNRRKSICNDARTSRVETNRALDGDDLSLDMILADIQNGKLKFDENSANHHQRSSRTSSELSSVCSSKPNRSESEPSKSDEARRQHELGSGFEIVWLNFTYSVEPNIFEDPRWGRINKLFHKHHRTILKGLSGGLKSGQMVALMGPSGAGKTCLLECISGIRFTGIGGKMFLRGRKKAQLVIVPQHDNFMPQFTVEEIITYGSKMKNPSNSNHREICDEVIEQLGLQVCRKNNIQACSGGQRKRVAIAQELVSKPNILILDEPTSGLDSSCCYQTMKVLREVLDKSVKTDEPMAIVTTIHQPSAKVFKMFDLVYLLGKTGYTAYSGSPNNLLTTIRDITGLECPQYSNPSDYMIELVSYDYGEEPVEELVEYEKLKAKQFVRDYELRSGLRINSNSLPDETMSTNTSMTNIECSGRSSIVSLSNDKISRSQNGSDVQSTLKLSKSDTHVASIRKFPGQSSRLNCQSFQHVEYKLNVSVPLRKATCSVGSKHPFFWHTYVHFHRSFLQSIRDPILNNMRILIHIGFATLLVLLFGKKSGEARGCPPILGLPTEITDPNNESMIDLADNVGYLFMCIMMITYVSLMSTVLTFPIDIKTVGKEYKNGWYGTLTYFLGKTIADLPFVIIYPIIYCMIVWFLTNQAPDDYRRFVSFTRLIIMNAMNSQSFGLILGALFVNSVTAATFLGPVMTIPWYLFTGFTKRVHRLAEPYQVASKFLFTRFVFEGLLDTAYGNQRCNCSEFLEKYYQLRYEEAIRLGQLVSVETLSSLDYYDSIDTIMPNKTFASSSESSKWFEKTVDAASTVFADGEDLNLASLMETNVKASSLFSFGLDFEPTCPSNYRNYIVQDFRLDDNSAEKAFYLTFFMLIVIRILTFIVVTWKIRTREL